MIRGKFTVASKTDFGGNYHTVVLVPRYSTNPEDQTYSAATPNGKIELTVTVPAVAEQLVAGQEFYVDFTPVEKPAS